ncbi:substrate-binding domain-containing protein, partial [Methanolacinia paynteri]|uniref:substrate-binding domain-containing protein n=1 Tax=Methanolacinia paynteri TaxID=230356 RepID=UPI00064F27DD
GIETGERSEITLLADKHLIDSAFLITGSHDPCLDYVADMAAVKGTNVYSCHVGSMGGILALKRRMCHAAPTHLLSPDGDYNTQYLRKYLPGEDLALICVADRQQGIASKDGIRFEELEEHTYVNRQRGSGTRVLLDYMLGQKGMDSSKISGYEREMSTHLDVALAIKNGDAEAGMCTLSAANIHGLKFVPVATEKYELAMYAETLEDERAKIVCDAIRSQAFKDILAGIGGYITENTGVMRYV